MIVVAGFGFRRAAGLNSFYSALTHANPQSLLISLIAAPAGKANSAALHAFAAQLGAQIVAVSPELLRTQVTLTQSAAAQSAYGVGSVAEACALAATGGGQLAVARVISEDGMATCALACIPDNALKQEITS